MPAGSIQAAWYSDTAAPHWAGLTAIAEGWFQPVSEVVCAGLRRLEENELELEALRAQLAAGEASQWVNGFWPQGIPCREMRANTRQGSVPYAPRQLARADLEAIWDYTVKAHGAHHFRGTQACV